MFKIITASRLLELENTKILCEREILSRDSEIIRITQLAEKLETQIKEDRKGYARYIASYENRLSEAHKQFTLSNQKVKDLERMCVGYIEQIEKLTRVRNDKGQYTKR